MLLSSAPSELTTGSAAAPATAPQDAQSAENFRSQGAQGQQPRVQAPRHGFFGCDNNRRPKGTPWRCMMLLHMQKHDDI